jgi:hypothetical protein
MMAELTELNENLNTALSNCMSLVIDVGLIHERLSRTQQQALRPHYPTWLGRFKTVGHSLSDIFAGATHFRGIQLLLYLSPTFRLEVDPFELTTAPLQLKRK